MLVTSAYKPSVLNPDVTAVAWSTPFRITSELYLRHNMIVWHSFGSREHQRLMRASKSLKLQVRDGRRRICVVTLLSASTYL
jgi:hypothetical protein